MIKGAQKKEQVFLEKPNVKYRELSALNQSMIKVFDEDPVKFFEEYKLGKKRKSKTNAALIIGDLVDFFLLECSGDEDKFHTRLDEQFAIMDGKKTTAQVFILADLLFDETEASLDADNVVTTSFETRFADAFAKIQEKGKYSGKTLDKALEDFEKNGKDYFQTRLDNIGKTVVDEFQINKAVTIGHAFLEDDFTREIFRGDCELFAKYPMTFTYETKSGRKVEAKAEIDILLIDHKNKKIYLKDLKTTYDNESFEYSYIKQSYYLQAAYYYVAVDNWRKLRKFDYYELIPMEFIVGDTSANNRRPIRYQTDIMDFYRGLRGFTMNRNFYRGVDELVDEILWCEENNIWNCSRQVYEAKGKLNLNIKYD